MVTLYFPDTFAKCFVQVDNSYNQAISLFRLSYPRGEKLRGIHQLYWEHATPGHLLGIKIVDFILKILQTFFVFVKIMPMDPDQV